MTAEEFWELYTRNGQTRKQVVQSYLRHCAGLFARTDTRMIATEMEPYDPKLARLLKRCADAADDVERYARDRIECGQVDR